MKIVRRAKQPPLVTLSMDDALTPAMPDANLTQKTAIPKDHKVIFGRYNYLDSNGYWLYPFDFFAIDISKAFDCIDITILLDEISRTTLHPNIIR